MPRFARIEDGVVVVTADCDDPAAIFHPDVARLYVAVIDGAKPGDLEAVALAPRSSRRREKK